MQNNTFFLEDLYFLFHVIACYFAEVVVIYLC